MGYYVEGPPKDKGSYIVNRFGAEKVSKPASFQSIPNGKGLVIVVDNGIFEAAAFAYDAAEFNDFTDPTDYRPKSYYLMDLATVKRLSGYNR